MKIYYHHTRCIEEAQQKWKENRHPGHILYGFTHFAKYGIECVYHPHRTFSSRLKYTFYNARSILFSKESYDILYGTSFLGLELIILLRALGLYSKPIVVWHHTAIAESKSKIRDLLSRFFYRGIDKMFFFSQRLIDDSLKTGKVKSSKMKLIYWGADMDFYDNLQANIENEVKYRFISTGKENRDFVTLINAFEKSSSHLDIFTTRSNGDKNYEEILAPYTVSDAGKNVSLHFVGGVIPYELAEKVRNSFAVVICCLPYHYTVGLTTLVEAMALGKPVIVSKNPYFEMDVEKEGIGLVVDYCDEQGWIDAINYLSDHPEEAKKMGEKGRVLAEKLYNLELFSKEIAEELQFTHSCLSFR